MQVILASKSPRRKDLLVQVGMDPLVMDSYVEEVTEALSPEGSGGGRTHVAAPFR